MSLSNVNVCYNSLNQVKKQACNMVLRPLLPGFFLDHQGFDKPLIRGC